MSKRTKELREILEGITTGKLLHYQESWYAGRDEVLQALQDECYPLDEIPDEFIEQMFTSDMTPVATCGTAHCVAGWRNRFTFEEETGDSFEKHIENGRERYVKWLEQKAYEARKAIRKRDDYWDGSWKSSYDGLVNEFVVAMHRWNLTLDQGFMLFGADATLDQQFRVLEELEREDDVVVQKEDR